VQRDRQCATYLLAYRGRYYEGPDLAIPEFRVLAFQRIMRRAQRHTSGDGRVFAAREKSGRQSMARVKVQQ
jgi:hypothetical protein